MGSYVPPLRDIQFVMHELLNTEATLQQLPAHAELDVDTINAIVEEAGKFSSQVIFPLNHTGDQEGCTLNGSAVTIPKATKKPTNNTSKPAGLRSHATLNTAAKACQSL